jgi:hypothetical protein
VDEECEDILEEGEEGGGIWRGVFWRGLGDILEGGRRVEDLRGYVRVHEVRQREF